MNLNSRWRDSSGAGAAAGGAAGRRPRHSITRPRIAASYGNMGTTPARRRTTEGGHPLASPGVLAPSGTFFERNSLSGGSAMGGGPDEGGGGHDVDVESFRSEDGGTMDTAAVVGPPTRAGLARESGVQPRPSGPAAAGSTLGALSSQLSHGTSILRVPMSGSTVPPRAAMRPLPTQEDYHRGLLELTTTSFVTRHGGASAAGEEGQLDGLREDGESSGKRQRQQGGLQTLPSAMSLLSRSSRPSRTRGGGDESTPTTARDLDEDMLHAGGGGAETAGEGHGEGNQKAGSGGGPGDEPGGPEGGDESALANPGAAGSAGLLGAMREARGAQKSNAFIHRACILDPRAAWLRQWDLALVLALVYTALVTPFEVAFLTPSVNPLFYTNRVIDVVFLADLVMHFFTAIPGDPTLSGGQWIQDYRTIARRYLRSWFLVDFVSALPFDLLALYQHDDQLQQLQAMRTLRLLRLARLFRVLRAVRIFRRWESSININYAIVGLVQFAILMFMSSHWLACLWRLTAELHSNKWDTWLGFDGLIDSTMWEQYVAAVYWAVMTLSTIGYGDIAAGTTLERAVSTVCMLVGSSIWAYIVGSICGVVSSLDAESLTFRRTMDELNYFMRDEHLPREMRQRLREYFHQRRALTKAMSYQNLLVQMSPSLRQEVAFHTNRRWLRHVTWFQRASKDFVSAVAVHLVPAVYAPKELVHGDEFSIVVRGVAAKDGKILTQGDTWGDDIILRGDEFRRATPARALTYLEVKSMSQEDLHMVLGAFPEEDARIRRIANRLLLRRAFIREAKRRKAELSMQPTYSGGKALPGSGDGGGGGQGGGAGAPSPACAEADEEGGEEKSSGWAQGGGRAPDAGGVPAAPGFVRRKGAPHPATAPPDAPAATAVGTPNARLDSRARLGLPPPRLNESPEAAFSAGLPSPPARSMPPPQPPQPPQWQSEAVQPRPQAAAAAAAAASATYFPAGALVPVLVRGGSGGRDGVDGGGRRTDTVGAPAPPPNAPGAAHAIGSGGASPQLVATLGEQLRGEVAQLVGRELRRVREEISAALSQLPRAGAAESEGTSPVGSLEDLARPGTRAAAASQAAVATDSVASALAPPHSQEPQGGLAPAASPDSGNGGRDLGLRPSAGLQGGARGMMMRRGSFLTWEMKGRGERAVPLPTVVASSSHGGACGGHGARASRAGTGAVTSSGGGGGGGSSMLVRPPPSSRDLAQRDSLHLLLQQQQQQHGDKR